MHLKKKEKKSRHAHAGLLCGWKESPDPARMADCDLQVLATRHLCRCSVAPARSPSPPAPRPASVCVRARGPDAQAQTTSSRSTCSVFVLCVQFFCTHFWSL